MTQDELREALASLNIKQADFAQLVGVTPRAVTLWLSGERAIHGAVEAYLRLFLSLPVGQRQVELARLNERKTAMREGMYAIEFAGSADRGVGALIFEQGRVYGADEAGVRYDGTYVFDEGRNVAEVQVKVTYPPNVEAVFGVTNPYEWSIDVMASFNPRLNSGPVNVRTSIGQQVKANYRYLRPLPEA